MEKIQIIDVIHHYHAYSKNPQIIVVLSRLPEWIYDKRGNFLVAHDDGFYDFLGIEPGSTQAFAGRPFNIKLTDGSTYECKGQVWSVGPKDIQEATFSVGIGTIESLTKCYVFSSASMSVEKYQAWMAKNKPSKNYHKYDPRESVEYQDYLYRRNPDWDKTICKQRARKLRHRGVTIRRHPVTGKLGWSSHYERRKKEILDAIAKDDL